MTPDSFRRAALDLPGTVESAHMDHPDFRVGIGKKARVFASLGPGEKPAWAMVKLSPHDQQAFKREAPESFEPCTGAWGRQGCTRIHLAATNGPLARRAILAAWRNVAPQRLVEGYDEEA
jgi:hypothetical protein